MMNILDITITNDTLKKFYPLDSFEDEVIRLIIGKSKLNHMQKNELMFKEGSNDSDIIYLIGGKIKLTTNSGEQFVLDSESEQSAYPIANLKPRRFSATVHSDNASIFRIPAEVIEPFMANSGTNAQLKDNSITHDSELKVFDSDWMMALAKTQPFSQLSVPQFEKLFQCMEEIKVKAGDTIITQGDEANYYYLVKKGQCLVSRNNGKKEIPLAELGPTESFGEEALLANATRNATVRMLRDGRLMRINQVDFHRFLKNQIIHWIDPDEVTNVLSDGAIKIDLTEKYKPDARISDAIKIPPFMLRNQMKKLSRQKTYLLLCDNDNECAVASYLMSLRGLKSFVLRGGAESLTFV
jgi:CRP-like cAMP-binding protein